MLNQNQRKEVPIGLAMSLALNEFAMEYYSGLDDITRDKITNYVQGGKDGWEAKDRINKAVKELSNKKTDFLN